MKRVQSIVHMINAAPKSECQILLNIYPFIKHELKAYCVSSPVFDAKGQSCSGRASFCRIPYKMP